MDLQRLMQQAQQMQRKIGQIEEELNATIYDGNNGGSNGVSVKVTGKFEVKEVSISEELLEKENKEMLQDMLMLALNEAISKASEDRDTKMGSVTQGVKFPGM